MKWTWQDTAEIAHELVEQYPGYDPLTIHAEDLVQLIRALPTFGDDPSAATQEALEAIQASWYDELQE